MDLSSQEVHLTHYWNVIQKRWKVATAILLVVMAATALASYFQKPLYRSQTRIQIERENPNATTIEDFFGIAASDQEFLQTQYVLLGSRGLALRVIEDHRLLRDKDFYPPGVEGKTKEEIHALAESMAPGLAGTVEIVPVRNTNLVDIFCIAQTPKLAQKIAEGWGESFMQMNVERKLDNVRQASEFLTKQIAQVKLDLEVLRGKMLAYGERKDIVSVNDPDSMFLKKYEQLTGDLNSARALRIQKQAEYESLQRTSQESVATNDPLVLRLNDDLSRQQREYQEKLARLRPGHPEMIQLADQIEKTKQSRQNAIAQAYEKAKEKARAEMASASGQESSLNNELAKQRSVSGEFNASAMAYFDLRTAVESKQTLLVTLEKQQNETEVTARLRGSATSNIHPIEHAQLPGGRFNLTMKKNLQSAVPLGIVLGLAAIFFLEYMDRSIKTPEEMERVTHFASLGIIPAAGSVSRQSGYNYAYGRSSGSGSKLRVVEKAPGDDPGIELIPYTDSRSPIAESYRAFRTALLLASANSPRVIVITSSFAREGKTTTSVNLATVLAQMGKPVLLIDADLRRPRLGKVFRDKMNLGLVNYLAANIAVEDVVQDTQVPNLSVILSGPIPPNPSELLASDRMKHLIEEVRSKFAFVIFDSPPVLAVTDAVVLATNADGVVLTVHGGQTPREL
ncbi:MAG TPA: polysaccharide biosynthesis tyrosine autokinase, partial [Thermoanaerobaculia bacterium]|nr:polysaccharide biosynthesis tyrosine autokinase [Thermoanaerobaculia bacterium]